MMIVNSGPYQLKYREEYKSRHDKTNKMNVRPAKTQINMDIRPVWSESSLCAQSVAKDPRFLHADSEDSDQTGRMPRLIWVLAGRTLTLLALSCRGSYASETERMWIKLFEQDTYKNVWNLQDAVIPGCYFIRLVIN